MRTLFFTLLCLPAVTSGAQGGTAQPAARASSESAGQQAAEPAAVNSPFTHDGGAASDFDPFGADGGPNDPDDIFGAGSEEAAPPPRRTPRGDRNKNADQQPAANQEAKPVPNPFDPPQQAGGMDMMMMEEDMGGMSDMGMGMGMEGMGGMEMGMGMGGYGGMYGDMGSQDAADARFRAGLQRAIKALREAKSPRQTEALTTYIKEALQQRYDESIQQRREELAQIRQRLTRLEADLKRREQAKQRVVEVQLQSVQLAAEGLMELDRP